MINSFLLLGLLAVGVYGRLTEEERVVEWKKNHQWPPKWHFESLGMKKRMEMREKEIMRIPESGERWENWLQYTQSRYVKKFTKHGYEIRDTPPRVRDMLLADVNRGINNWDNLRSEGHINVVYGSSKFVDMRPTLEAVHDELLDLHEEWAGGIKLKQTSIYGVRLYENQTSLAMHLDKVNIDIAVSFAL